MGSRKQPTSSKSKRWLAYVQRLRCKPIVDVDEGATPTGLPTILEMAERSDLVDVGCYSTFDMTAATERTMDLEVEEDELADYVHKDFPPFDAGACVDVESLGPFIREVIDPQPGPHWEWNTDCAPSVDFAPVVQESQQLIDKATSVLHDMVQEVIDPQPAVMSDDSLLPSMRCASSRFGHF